jgi:hypothetical protein
MAWNSKSGQWEQNLTDFGGLAGPTWEALPTRRRLTAGEALTSKSGETVTPAGQEFAGEGQETAGRDTGDGGFDIEGFLSEFFGEEGFGGEEMSEEERRILHLLGEQAEFNLGESQEAAAERDRIRDFFGGLYSEQLGGDATAGFQDILRRGLVDQGGVGTQIWNAWSQAGLIPPGTTPEQMIALVNSYLRNPEGFAASEAEPFRRALEAQGLLPPSPKGGFERWTAEQLWKEGELGDIERETSKKGLERLEEDYQAFVKAAGVSPRQYAFTKYLEDRQRLEKSLADWETAAGASPGQYMGRQAARQEENARNIAERRARAFAGTEGVSPALERDLAEQKARLDADLARRGIDPTSTPGIEALSRFETEASRRRQEEQERAIYGMNLPIYNVSIPFNEV